MNLPVKRTYVMVSTSIFDAIKNGDREESHFLKCATTIQLLPDMQLHLLPGMELVLGKAEHRESLAVTIVSVNEWGL